MSDLDTFIPSEESEGFDAAAFEKFKDKVKKGAAAAAKTRKQEAKRKKKENKLVQILLKLIGDKGRKGLLFLIARLLEEDIPPLFVLSLVTLGMEEVREEIAKVREEEIKEQLAAPEDYKASEMDLAVPDSFEDSALPIKVKAELDTWVKGIYEAGTADAVTVLDKAMTDNGAIKQVLIDCASTVMSEYFESMEELPNMPYDGYYNFTSLVMKNLFVQLKKQVKNQMKIEGEKVENI